MRCDQCNKFVSFEEAEPEVNDLTVSEDGDVAASVRIVNQCQECGQELTETTFDLEASHGDEIKEHKGKGHELEIEEDGCERTSRSGWFKKGQFVAAHGRYAKTFYGASLNYNITCSCGKLESVGGTLEDDCQASGMEQLV